jgi:hypothetical protein
MKRWLLPFILSLSLTSPLLAALTPGPIIPDGLSLPVIADLNGDGLTDLVQNSDVLLNYGNGVFVLQPLPLTGSDVARAALDVNGDGRADLLTIDRTSGGPGGVAAPNSFRVYVANGSGLTFTPHPLPVPNGLRTMPYVAEINGDGKDDVVLVHQVFSGNTNIATEVIVLRSNGDGTFTTLPPFRLGPSPQDLVRATRLLAGDFDHDGNPDLVFRMVNELIILRGTGGGAFGAPQSRYLPAAAFAPFTTDLGDVDQDGHLDIVVAARRVVRVFFNDGTGRFTRHAMGRIADVRKVVIPDQLHPDRLPNLLDVADVPRNMVFGSFVVSGRSEIGLGAADGDVVVFAYERGALREVARLATEYLLPDLHPGSFLAPGSKDLYITWNFGYAASRPKSRLIDVETIEAASAAPAHAGGGRARSVNRGTAETLTIDVSIAGDCGAWLAETWQLQREGIFASAKTDARLIEATPTEDAIYVRFTAPWASTPVEAKLVPDNGLYTGTAAFTTTCGYQEAQLRAVVK